MNAQGIGHEANAIAPDLGAASQWPHTRRFGQRGVESLSGHVEREFGEGITRPALAEMDWEDLFAYFIPSR